MTLPDPPPAPAVADALAWIAETRDALRRELASLVPPSSGRPCAPPDPVALAAVCRRIEQQSARLAHAVLPAARRAVAGDPGAVERAIANLHDVRRAIAHALAQPPDPGARHDPLAQVEARLDRQFAQAQALLRSPPEAAAGSA